MIGSLDYLNSTMRFGRFFLVQLIRLVGSGLAAYSAQVVAAPSKSSGGFGRAPTGGANEADFLAAIVEPAYRDAMADLLAGSRALGLVLQWYSKGASIRLRTPDRNEPLSVGWVFLEDGQWYGARHVTLGADDDSLGQTPSVAPAVHEYRRRLKSLPGAMPVASKLNAYTFVPSTFPAVKNDVLQILEQLVAEVADT
jgi:hypothetical protein